MLWHQEYPEDMARFDACLPDNHPAHTLIGGGTTVGLSAMVLAYAMGFRKLHLYGYDSSYRESRHAYPQTDPQNVDCVATVAGKSFHTSLAMARQAELFPELSDSLIDLGCVITIRGDGLLPWTSQQAAIHIPMAEPDKYTAMWAHDSYRNVSPGELVAQTFIEICKPSGLVADLGCGTGRGAIEIAKAGCEVVLVDFTENSRDPEAKSFNFLKADLSKPIPLRADYGYCCDVMEHIPPEQVDTVIRNVMAVAPKAFFQISTVPDQMGVLIGEKLHLSVHPLRWWIDRFNSLGFAVQWSEETENAALIYSTT
jgi:SAM-dependent methyltransferase